MAKLNGTSKGELLTGSVGNDLIYGLGGNDTLKGLGGNDLLNGGAGADAMTGGTGNDVYYVNNAGDTTIENAGEGIDTVKSTINWTLGANLDNLQLIGTAAINGTGNALANTIIGNAAANVLTGLGGNDKLDGRAGADTMTGGTGNDTYTVDNIGDRVIESFGEGTDTIRAGISQTLGANIEKLLLTGTGAIDGTGNTLSNTLTGNDAANVLTGLSGDDVIVGAGGNDRIVGGTGRDTMTGGTGTDTFVFASTDFASRSSIGADVIVDFTSGDKVDLSAIDALVSASGYGQPGDQAFVFIGQNSFHNHSGRELRYEISGGNTYVYGNMNGDTTADWCIQLTGVHTMSSADFVL